MALNDCIEKALKARRITDKQVQDIKRLVEQEQRSDLVDDLDKLTRGNLMQVMKGQETRFRGEVARFAKRGGTAGMDKRAIWWPLH